MEQLLTETEFNHRLHKIRGKRFPLLAHGGITLINVMGRDQDIVDAARTTSNIEPVTDKDDGNLIRYLMRHRHSTPVEFPIVRFLVECPMDLWRQWIRHRTASVNEFSSRYSKVPDINDTTEPDKWRLQSKGNRQGSSAEFVTAFPPGYVELCPAGVHLTTREAELHKLQRDIYEERMRFGVANEQARKDLCLSQYTRAYWQNDLHNTLHFLGLRMDSHAQLEIRQFANKMGEILAELYPATWQAFLDYRLNAMTLTALDQVVIRNLVTNLELGDNETSKAPYTVEDFLAQQHPNWYGLKSCREDATSAWPNSKTSEWLSRHDQALVPANRLHATHPLRSWTGRVPLGLYPVQAVADQRQRHRDRGRCNIIGS